MRLATPPLPCWWSAGQVRRESMDDPKSPWGLEIYGKWTRLDYTPKTNKPKDLGLYPAGLLHVSGRTHVGLHVGCY